MCDVEKLSKEIDERVKVIKSSKSFSRSYSKLKGRDLCKARRSVDKKLDELRITKEFEDYDY